MAFRFGPKRYDDIKIGTQTWMSKNLSAVTYNNGDPIAFAPYGYNIINFDSGKSYCYVNNVESTKSQYGLLYTGYAINDPRGLVPVGYHIPSYTEWMVLINYLGGTQIAGGKLKYPAAWLAPNTAASNESGFSAVGAGSRVNTGGGYTAADFNISTLFATNNTNQSFAISYNSAAISLFSINQYTAISVRCIKD